MPKDREHITEIIEALEHIRRRPGMFAGENTFKAVASFLIGFDIACGVAGLHVLPGMRYKAETERGWKSGAEAWVLSQLRASGMAEEAIVDEMFAITILSWSLTAEAISE